MIALQDVSITVGAFTLRHIALEIPTGCYCALMGRSGAGKTTLLEAICGLNSVTAGRILLMGQDVTDVPPAQRGIGFVPQDGALFPTMSVRENLSFPLRMRKWPTAQIAQRVDELAALLGIAHLLNRHTQGLSGGETKRVSLGRALAARPRLLCLDEPLSALDDTSRANLCDLLCIVKAQTGVTAIHITHSADEMQQVADMCLLLEAGGIKPLSSNTALTTQSGLDTLEQHVKA